jgi:hypothetical protein
LIGVETVPEFRGFHRRIWAGEVNLAVNLADNQMKTIYGGVHWERFLQDARQARYN